MNPRLLAPLVFLTLGAPAPASAAAVSAPIFQGQPKFVRTTDAGTKVYAWSDRNSKVVRTLPAGSLLQVHEELTLDGGGVDLSYMEISVVDGLEVWVYGQYLEEVPGREGVLRCTGDRVRMRPGPGKSTINLPLSTHLMKGEEVRFLARNEASLPMAEDWVQVRSPQHAKAWVLADGVQAVSDATEARGQWAAAGASNGGTPTSTTAELGQGTPTGAGAAGTSAAALGGMALADQIFAKARAGEASFADAVTAYEEVLANSTPGTSQHALASNQLDRARAGVELEEIQKDYQDKQLQEAAARQQASMDAERDKLKDTMHWGRFNGRGWLRPRTVAGQRRYYLEWQGDVVREIACASGRYDLDIFEDCEVGVKGNVLRHPTPGSVEGPPQPQLLDVTRIEVISVRK